MLMLLSSRFSPCPLCLSGYCGGRDFLPPPDPLPLTKADWIGPSITEASSRRGQLCLEFLLLDFEHHRGIWIYTLFLIWLSLLCNHADVLHRGILRHPPTSWSHPRVRWSSPSVWRLVSLKGLFKLACVSARPVAEQRRQGSLPL
jgi:hypothetical protein